MSRSIQSLNEDFLSSIKLLPIFPIDLRKKINFGYVGVTTSWLMTMAEWLPLMAREGVIIARIPI